MTKYAHFSAHGEEEKLGSCVELKFRLERQQGFLISQSYVPCALVVALSWIVFWIPVTDLGGRITIALTAILILKLNTAATHLPSTYYIKAIDAYKLVCTIFVFLSGFESTFVNYMHRKNPHVSHPHHDEVVST